MSAARFAVYFVPDAKSDLYRFGAGVIGYDACCGADLPRTAGFGSSDADWRELTHEPRKYGFHATLKAPFYLCDDANEQALIETFERFAAERRTAPSFVPDVRLLGGFAAIEPRGPYPAIRELADACVVAFEPFRAPLSAQDRQRRVAAGLSETQTACLDRWGYPYVFDEFRFHMTLTGPLPANRRADVLAQLRTGFAEAVGEGPIAVDRLALVHQPCATGRFRVLRHVQIGTGGRETA